MPHTDKDDNARGIAATEAFAAQLAMAILDGTERDRDPGETTVSDVRPLRFVTPLQIPPDGPAKPLPFRNDAGRFEQKHRRQRARDDAMRVAIPQRPRPPFDCLEIADLSEDTCRYPHAGETILFCGRTRERGSYCAGHARVCFR